MQHSLNNTHPATPPWNKGNDRRQAAAADQTRVVYPRQTPDGWQETRLFRTTRSSSVGMCSGSDVAEKQSDCLRRYIGLIYHGPVAPIELALSDTASGDPISGDLCGVVRRPVIE